MEPKPNSKRRSIDVEDEAMVFDEPPTKQLLSEKDLFKKFGSLHIDSGNETRNDEDDEDLRSRTNGDDVAQEEFNRYVYLLFQDIKKDSRPFEFSNSTMDRLAREERDKLSKAVILWSPPISNRFNSVSDDEDLQDDSTLASQNDVEFSPG